MAQLQPTRGNYKLRGQVVGFNEEAVREGETKKGGKPYKSLKFGVKTSPTNTVFVELFGMEKDFVMGYNRKWEEKGVDKTIRADWDERDSLPEGYQLMGTNLNLERDTKGKLVKKIMVELEAIDYIAEHITNGDFVFIGGQPDYSEYTNQQNETKEQTRFTIGSISANGEINFEAEDFEETCSFVQEFVVQGLIPDKENNKLNVTGYIINKVKDGFKVVNTTFVVDGNTQPKFLETVKKKFKFGDLVKVYGEIKNGVTVTAVDANDEEDEWGGKVPSGYNKSYVRDGLSELRITGIYYEDDAETGKRKYFYEAKKYKEEDFQLDDADNEFGDDMGGKPLDISDDDLPF